MATLGHYVATVDDAGVQIHQYTPAVVRADGVRLRLATDYPWDGTVTATVEASGEAEWTLSLRIPGWAEGARASVNGTPVPAAADGLGYLRLSRPWRAGDEVRLELPMPARVTAPHPRVEAIRGRAALERGPLVYCLEAIDHPEAGAFDAIRLVSDAAPRAAWRPDLLEGAVALECDGRVGDDAVALTAIPYFLWGNRGAGAMRVWVWSTSPGGEQ
jgi:DUF1680 family protein